MSRQDDEKSAEQLGLSLDLGALVADVRAERVESLPQDDRFALALVLLASQFDEAELAELLAVPAEVIGAAGRHLCRQVYRELVLRALKDRAKTRKTKEID